MPRIKRYNGWDLDRVPWEWRAPSERSMAALHQANLDAARRTASIQAKALARTVSYITERS